MATRERSPNYPAFGLDAAVEMARKINNRERRAAVPLPIIAKALGHAKVSGPARSKVATLRQYGLIESIGGEIKISDRAFALVKLKPGDPEYDKAVREAALAPPLFAELKSAHADKSDEALDWHLTNDRKFSADGARRVIEAFKATMTFAKLDDDSYTDGNDGAEDEEEPPPAVASAVSVFKGGQERGRIVTSATQVEAANYPLPGGVAAKIVLVGKPTKRALEKLAANIQDWADFLEDSPDEG